MSKPTDVPADRLVRSLNSILHDSMDYSGYSQKTAKDYITIKDMERICKYLKNPTSCGLWLFKGKWLGAQGITHEITEELKNLEKSGIKAEKKRRIEEISERLLETTSRMTFTFSLFVHMVCSEGTENKNLSLYRTSRDNDRILLEKLDSKRLNDKYSKELDCFKSRIFYEGFNPLIDTQRFIYTKTGLVFPQDVSRNNHIETEKWNRWFTFMALEPEPLESLAEFFNIIGKISDYTIAPIYSPEEDVFGPYFSFLELACDRLFQKGKIRTLIEQSISIFNDQNYPYCISTIGLILEEQLTQIYETLLRNRCPQGLTLGELLDLFEKEVRSRVVSDNQKKAIDSNSIYERINNSLERNTSSHATNDDMLKIIRDILTFVKENNKQILSKFNPPQKKESISIFPNKLRDGMDELIMYRNAISHRSRIPIGGFETLKSIYHISSLIMWWNEEMKLANWKDSSDVIIKEMIKRNNPQVTSQIS